MIYCKTFTHRSVQPSPVGDWLREMRTEYKHAKLRVLALSTCAYPATDNSGEIEILTTLLYELK
jgi:hypothetical protein